MAFKRAYWLRWAQQRAGLSTTVSASHPPRYGHFGTATTPCQTEVQQLGRAGMKELLSQLLNTHNTNCISEFMHSIGLSSRPRLKGRPSLYDLVRATTTTAPKVDSTDRSPVATAKLVDTHPELIASAVPLPASPQQQRRFPYHHHHRQSSSQPSELPQPANIPKANITMAPVRSPPR